MALLAGRSTMSTIPNKSRSNGHAGQVDNRRMHQRAATGPSKLEQLRDQYHKKIVQERDEKIRNIRNEFQNNDKVYTRSRQWQENAGQEYQRGNVPDRQNDQQIDYRLRSPRTEKAKNNNSYEERSDSYNGRMDRVPQSHGNRKMHEGRGNVRDFFKQRQNADNDENSIHQHYKKFQKSTKVNPRDPPYLKTSAGKDRSNPLPPIEKKNVPSGEFNENPPKVSAFQSKPKLVKHQDMNSTYKVRKEHSNPNTPQDSDRKSGSSSDPDNNENLSPTMLNRLHKKNIQVANKHGQESSDDESIEYISNTKPSKSKKMTDFEKWQLKQDKEKAERLKRHRERNKVKKPDWEPIYIEDAEEDERQKQKNAEIAKKEQELMALIQKQQDELDRMKRQRQQEEEQERVQMDKQKRREAAQTERHRSLLEAEERARSTSSSHITETPDPQRNGTQRNQAPMQENYHEKDEEQFPQKSAQQFFPTKPVKAKPKGPKRRPPPKQLTPAPDPSEERTFTTETSYYASAVDEEANMPLDLVPCSFCGRKFARERIDKHQNACDGGNKKKRKVFDPVKMRTDGTEQAKFVSNAARRPNSDQRPKKNNWRANHENFIQAIRYARKVQEVQSTGGDLSKLPPPPPSENPDYIQCPHCKRKFNQTAAERHIPKCKDIKAKPTALKAKRR